MRITDTHVYFWGGPFSQWYMSDFKSLGREYCCAEQYMMEKKALIFNDLETRQKIMDSKDPKEIKALGRQIKNFDPKIWDKIKLTIVINGNYAKFSCNKELWKLINETGDKILVEASPYDKIWGVGLAEEDDRILDESNWQGENLLGKALMTARTSLRRHGKFDE